MKIKTPARKLYTGRACFLRVAPEVRDAVQAGFTLVAIYTKNRGRLKMSYRSFARYAREYLKPGLLPDASAASGDPRSASGENGRLVATEASATTKSSACSGLASPTSAERGPGQPLEITLGPAFSRLHDPTNSKDLV